MSDITTISGSDSVKDSRAIINANFEALNEDKLEFTEDLENITSITGKTGETLQITNEESVEIESENSYVALQSDQEIHLNSDKVNINSSWQTGGISVFRSNLETTDNVATTLASLEVLDDQAGIFIEARIVAGRIAGSSGSEGDSAAYIRRGLFKKVDGTISLVGSVQDGFTSESQAGWNATLGVSGSDIIVTVTGATNNQIEWTCELLAQSAEAGLT